MYPIPEEYLRYPIAMDKYARGTGLCTKTSEECQVCRVENKGCPAFQGAAATTSHREMLVFGVSNGIIVKGAIPWESQQTKTILI